jgi:hypothetical protein
MTENKKSESLNRLWIPISLVVFFVLLLIMFIFPEDAFLFWRSIKVFFWDFWWILLPYPMWHVYDFMWQEYTENVFLSKFEYVVLELIPPKDIEKSPKLMEHVFTGLHDYSTPNNLEIHAGWKMLQPKMSFEIAGDAGKVHFYIRCPKQMRNNVEAQVYAHYPDIEVYEVEDYVNDVPKSLPNDKWTVWGVTYKYAKNPALPIRTYRNFQEDVTGKMVDPLANVIEVMSALPKDQHIWLQIVVMPEKAKNWHPASEAYIQELMDEYLGRNKKKSKIPFFNIFQEIFVVPGNIFRGMFGGELNAPAKDVSTEEENVEFNINKLPPGVQERVQAINDCISKDSFQTVIRFVSVGSNENWSKPLSVGGIRGAMRQFADTNLNDLVTDNKTKTYANYYFDKERELYKKRKIVADYRSRAGSGMWMLMNTEALATLYHFPDMVIRNPAVTRIESRKEDAPADLPVGVGFEESGK